MTLPMSPSNWPGADKAPPAEVSALEFEATMFLSDELDPPDGHASHFLHTMPSWSTQSKILSFYAFDASISSRVFGRTCFEELVDTSDTTQS